MERSEIFDMLGVLQLAGKLGRGGRIADGITRVDLLVLDELGYRHDGAADRGLSRPPSTHDGCRSAPAVGAGREGPSRHRELAAGHQRVGSAAAQWPLSAAAVRLAAGGA